MDPYPKIAVRVPPQMRDELDHLALQNGFTVSALVKEFIKVGIALQKKRKKRKAKLLFEEKRNG